MKEIERLKKLVNLLNDCRDSYYNDNISTIADEEYDKLFDELEQLEKYTGVIMSNSPTQTVGYSVQSKLKKVKHNHPMLSLGKTKDLEEIKKFCSKSQSFVMLKMDGLTCSLAYNSNGDLISAETRGNGEVGEDVLENIKTVKNIPLKINNNGAPLIVDGEVIIGYDDFEKINSNLSDDLKYSHTRNLAAGSIRQLDSKIASERNMKFIAWKMISGSESNVFEERLLQLVQLGFEVVPFKSIEKNTDFEKAVEEMKESARSQKYPIDGLVWSYSDIKYGESLGSTNHHVLSQKAYKFYDDVHETVLRNIEWSTSRTGQVNPVAIFDEVDLDGAITTRATLHNLTIMKKLELGIGDTITVFRANQVIPKIDDNLTRSNNYVYPTICPSCGEVLTVKKDNDSEVLMCINDNCPSKMLSKFVHFVSKPALNIDGLSEATLEKFIGEGFVSTYKDIYHLDRYKDQIIHMEGFGIKSYNKLIEAIENSRKVKLENFLIALGIPNIGKTASKTISKYFQGNYDEFFKACRTNFDFTNLEDFGKVMDESLHIWCRIFDPLSVCIIPELNFIIEEVKDAIQNDFINGKIFCVTGAFKTKKRSELEQIISDRAGKLSGSVSKKTDYLLTNEADSGSSKAKKANELNIPIMTEEEFLSRV